MLPFYQSFKSIFSNQDSFYEPEHLEKCLYDSLSQLFQEYVHQGPFQTHRMHAKGYVELRFLKKSNSNSEEEMPLFSYF